MLTEKEVLDLCNQYREHRLTETEYRKLHEWINESEENRRFFANYVKLYKAELRAEAYSATDASKAWTAIDRKRRQRHLRLNIYRSIAAACLLGVAIGLSVYFHSEESMQLPETTTTLSESLSETFPDVPLNKVTLTLSSGQQVVLDKDSMLAISDKGNIVAQGTNTSLNYTTASTPTASPQYNTISVPQGSVFSLTLSDGTLVTLNSSTTFRYPVAFSGDRRVELDGEAFFDVAHTGTRFIVDANGKEVNVLGTRFNLSAYPRHDFVTTLVEGKVEVKSGSFSKQLSAGQQATVNDRTEQITVKEVDADLYVSWVAGKYEFSQTPLETILSQLELWYGMKIEYQDDRLRLIHFDGTVFRNKPLGFSLEIIQQVSNVQFTKKDQTIIVGYKR